MFTITEYFQTRWQFNPRTLHYINDNRSKSLWITNFEGVTSLFGYASIYFFNLSSSLIVRSYLSTDTNNDSNNGITFNLCFHDPMLNKLFPLTRW
ncbi:unnamed protein product [Schistosoma guineensis]|nr:unnamed protein product [Schistosoma guineensis]